MAEKQKTLSVDINLSPETVEQQTKQIVASIQKIGQQLQGVNTRLTNIFKKINTQTSQTVHNTLVQVKNTHQVNTNIKQVAQNTKKVADETKKVDKSTGSWLGKFSKFGISVAVARQSGRIIAQLIKESGSWIENLNLFEVTFGQSYQKYLDWSVKFAKNLGFSVNQMVKFTGLFKQLSTSIGIAQQTGDRLAKTLTALGTDITSFYNLQSITQAMEKLQAGVYSGQTKPLRSIGIDKQKCYVTLHSDVYRKQGEPTNVGCNNYILMVA